MSQENPNPNPEAVDSGKIVDSSVTTSGFNLDTLKEAGIPESYFGQDGAVDFKGIATHLGEAQALKTAAEARAALIPTDGKYDFGLPKDWKAPDGSPADFAKGWTFGSDEESAQYAAFAKAQGMSQAQVSDFIAIRASVEASRALGEAKAATEFHAAEMAKLGPSASTRIENLGKALTAKDGIFGEKLGKAIALAPGLLSDADTVMEMEKFINSSKHAARRGSEPNPNEGLAEHVGKVGGGLKILEAANASRH